MCPGLSTGPPLGQGTVCCLLHLSFSIHSCGHSFLCSITPVLFPSSCRGDHNLRSSYGRCILELMRQLPSAQAPADVKAVLDLGCATGLSSLALSELFPAAQITGLDLSPHMVAVGRYHQERREVGIVAVCAKAHSMGLQLSKFKCPCMGLQLGSTHCFNKIEPT